MHKIVQGHLKDFVREHSIENLPEDKQFELFANYCIISQYYPTRFDLDKVTTDVNDSGIDGLAFIADGELILSADEAEALFSKPKRNIDVVIIFIQAKRSESFSRGDILKFGDGVEDFFRDEPNLPKCELLLSGKEIFEETVNNVSKVANGKPNIKLFYVTTGIYEKRKEIVGTIDNIKERLRKTGLFYQIDFTPVDRELLINYWVKTWKSIEAKIDVKGYTPYPEMKGVNEAYLCIVSAKEIVEKILIDEDNKIRNFIFQENVRHFLGEDNPVNKSIEATLRSNNSKERFAILNNGITIISPDVRVQSDTISLRDFQIVNGCQTCHVLYYNYPLLSDNVMVTAKIVEAEDTDVITEIVKATNSQSKVEEIQFYSLKPVIKNIEAYFDAVNKELSDDEKIYFERRDKQFVGKSIPDIRIFDIKDTARAVASMFWERPDLAARYPSQMFEELSDKIYQEGIKEIIYYTANLAAYRLHLLRSNARIPYKYGKYKWHMLMCLKYIVNKHEEQPDLKSSKIEGYCEKIISACRDYERNMHIFEMLVQTIKTVGEVDRDSLKGFKYIHELKAYLN
ncbi:AIPR family protein [Desulfofundulus thermocisternus]|uniref:AIPR family protein n=1 Tax=Desulfofundulus thermocisternus TaxID=42471 RepID=UPI00217E099F|nr:AIPR family protein [Desulfofundulus thermocisternus]MCS5695409.1 AIPR family protein [Desulfofundulus thermocisternus]